MLAGDERTGVKDPFVLVADGAWHMWLCCHPLEDPEATDRMVTRHATSSDGVRWDVGEVALAPRPGTWDARGARVATVQVAEDGTLTAYYDGRATAGQNAEELTGLAVGQEPGRLVAQGDGPLVRSDSPSGSLRYLSVVDLPDGGQRLYYEATRRDGAHDLRTEYVPPAR